MTDKLKTTVGEFDQSPEFEHWEPEKKFTLNDIHFFDFLLDTHDPVAIEQIYLSAPDEASSLRVRQATYVNGDVRYTAALKAEGRIVPNGLLRRETPTAISAETFAYYQAGDFPRLRKIRVEPFPGVSVDWIEGYASPLVELENLGINQEAVLFLQEYQGVLVEKTGQQEVNNEWIAHQLSGKERLPRKELTVDKMIHDIEGYRHYGVWPIVVTIDGRSGSGKSTVAAQLERQLRDKRIDSVLLSTDDYHRGRTWLEAHNDGQPWKNWDDPIVYDTQQLAQDMTDLRAGKWINKRRFDFRSQEVAVGGAGIRPTDVIIVEGIYGGTRDLDGIRHFHYNVPTPLATAVYRDLARIRSSDRPNSTIGSPEERLRYQLEVAEPAFRSIDRISKKDLREFRIHIGKHVLQLRSGEVVHSTRSQASQTPALRDSTDHH